MAAIETGSSPPVGEGQLQKRLSTLTMVAMSFAILNTWICNAGTMGLVLPSGGCVSFIYGFIICVICNFAITASLGELAAIWPTAGGQYHFVYALCTEKWRGLMSFVVGWINIAGWLTLVTTEGFFAAQLIAAASFIATDGEFKPQQWSTYLFFLTILTFATVTNIWGNKILGAWNTVALYWSIMSATIISIVLFAMSKKTEASYVFTGFANQTGWSDGMAFVLGLLQSALSLIGFDVVLHMTEEMPNPRTDAPKAMIYAIAVGGVTGFVFILAILFGLDDPSKVIDTPTGMPIVELVFQVTKNRAAACIISLMLAVCFINGTCACTTSVSRLMYAMARDKGIVFHRMFAHLDKKLDVPVRTILFSFIFNACFGLLYLGPSVAFNAFIASCTIFLNLSYAIPIIVLLVRGRDVLNNFRGPNTPFQLGRQGVFINWVAVLFVIFTSIFFCFPPQIPVSSNTMNYVCVGIGIFIAFVVLYWLVYGKTFEGPDLGIIHGELPNSGSQDSVALGNIEEEKTATNAV